jgi:hypothetical protein
MARVGATKCLSESFDRTADKASQGGEAMRRLMYLVKIRYVYLID